MGDADALQDQATRVRAQADALHRANQTTFESRSVEHGVAKDKAVREAAAARADVAKAAAQADQLEEGAKSWDTMAADLEASAAQDAAKGEARSAEENREFAEGFRSNGRAEAARAKEARAAADAQTARATELEGRVKALEADGSSSDTAIQGEKVADQLDDKARLMEEAVRLELIADQQRAEGKTDEAAATEALVTEAWSKAEAIQPDLGGVDPLVLRDAGLTPPTLTDTTSGSPETPGGDSTMAENDTPALRDPVDLAGEAAGLRQQAARMHQEAGTRLQRHLADSGTERDEAATEAWALRQKAKSADIQAQREHREATKVEGQAAEYDAKAAALEKEGKGAEAQEERETADGLRAMARSHTQRAQAAEQRAQDAITEAAPHEQKVRDYEADKGFDRQPQTLERVGDQLDDKAKLIEDAVAARAEAYRLQDAGDQAGAVAAAQRAVDAQAKADAISPEYDELDVEAKAATGLDDPAIEIGEPSPSPTPSRRQPAGPQRRRHRAPHRRRDRGTERQRHRCTDRRRHRDAGRPDGRRGLEAGLRQGRDHRLPRAPLGHGPDSRRQRRRRAHRWVRGPPAPHRHRPARGRW